MCISGPCEAPIPPASRPAAKRSLRHPVWLPEIKYDGYRLIVTREGNRVRLFTRNGHDWSSRYPLIVESALKNRHSY